MNFDNVEKARQEYKQKIIKKVGIAMAISVLLALIMFLANGGKSILIFVCAILSYFILSIIILVMFFFRKDHQKYCAAYKAYFVENNLRRIFTDLKYNHTAGLAREILAATQMINTGDIYTSNDLATGKYNGVSFAQADVCIQEERTDSDGNTQRSTIFKGRFMIFEFPKKFNFRLEVVEKWFGASKVPGKNRVTGRKFEKIQVESPEFNKMFKIYAEDGFEAFYLLDPAFINDIVELGQKYKGKILLCFVDNRLIVGLNDGKDAFEPPFVFKKIDEKVEATKVASDINVVTEFVDKLRLNRRIFK